MCDESLAADAATPCEKLFELANSSQLVIARIVAANASISPDVVAALQLRKDPKINRALAANPAIPMAILQKLGVRYTSEFVHNPIFKMEQISDPLFLTHLPSVLIKKILTHESTPESILLWASEHLGDFDFAKYDEILECLISSPRSLLIVYNELPAYFRQRIAQRENLPQEIFCALAADQNVDVRLAVAERHDLPTTVVQQLSSDADAGIRQHIAQREHLPQEIVCALAADQDVGVRWRVAGRHDLSTTVVQQLSNDTDAGIRQHIAEREHLPQEIVYALAADEVADVRWRVARRHDLSTTVVQQLSNDSNAGIRKQIAHRARLSQEIVCALAADQDVIVRRAVAGRHDLSEAAVRQLSIDQDELVRRVLLRRIFSWAIVLEEKPDESVVTNSDFRDRIIATGLPWRVRDIGTNIEMLLIPPGRFIMGELRDDARFDDHERSFLNYDEFYDVREDAFSDRESDALPAHEVFISKAFYLGRTPVTQGQWQAKIESNPNYFQSPTYTLDASRPVEGRPWDMIQEFNRVTGLRLPTEAEWEYACRAGDEASRYGVLNDIAWHSRNSCRATHSVATKLPNALGLYDMLGNVWELCADWYGEYSSGSVTNPTGPTTGSLRLARGGSGESGLIECRAWRRYIVEEVEISYLGFRVARNP